MIVDYFKGVYVSSEGLDKVFEVKGFGYKVTMISGDSLRKGESYKIYVVNITNEFSTRSYGFLEEEDRKVFKKLILIKGIGPNTAGLIILNSSVDKIKHAISSKDIEFFVRFPKIGYKTASLLVENTSVSMQDNIKSSSVYVGLKNLGFESKKIIETLRVVDDNLSEEEKMRSALSIIVKKT